MNATVGKAARYFKRAADQGDADAQRMDAKSTHLKMAGKTGPQKCDYPQDIASILVVSVS